MSKKSKERKRMREAEKNVTKENVTDAKEQEIKEVEIVEGENFPRSSEQGEKEDIFLEGRSIDEIIEEESSAKQNKNYLAVIILLLGALLGSLFIDVAQLLSKKGYSVKALKEADVFTLDDKTWVAYDEPVVDLTVLTVSSDELNECPTCQPPAEVTDLFGKVMPTLTIKEVDINSEEGKKIAKENKVKVLPAMIFSDGIKETEFYKGEAKVLFSEIKDSGNFKLSLAGLGLPIGKYIELPAIDEGDAMLGNKDAAVKIILFSDHQCPYCAKSFKEVVKTIKSYGDKVVLVYKDLPLEFHPQAMNAAIAGKCAQEQGKFWEMSDKLYVTQKQWGNMKDKSVKDFFKNQARILGLKTDEFNKCLDENRHKEEVENSKKQAEEFGVAGTPSLFVGDEFVGGAIPMAQLKAMINAKIKTEEDNKK
jgi:protein-disulfide isomerase